MRRFFTLGAWARDAPAGRRRRPRVPVQLRLRGAQRRGLRDLDRGAGAQRAEFLRRLIHRKNGFRRCGGRGGRVERHRRDRLFRGGGALATAGAAIGFRASAFRSLRESVGPPSLPRAIGSGQLFQIHPRADPPPLGGVKSTSASSAARPGATAHFLEKAKHFGAAGGRKVVIIVIIIDRFALPFERKRSVFEMVVFRETRAHRGAGFATSSSTS